MIDNIYLSHSYHVSYEDVARSGLGLDLIWIVSVQCAVCWGGGGGGCPKNSDELKIRAGAIIFMQCCKHLNVQ